MVRPSRLGSLLAFVVVAVAAVAVVACSGSALAAPTKKHAVAVAARSKDGHTKDKDKDKASAAAEPSQAAHAGAGAKEPKTRGAKAKARVGGPQSIGAPNAGKLTGALLLRRSRYLRQREHAHSWGLPALVHLVQRAAGRVARKHKNAVMLVGDLSGKTGGHIDGHASHQSGRDVDIGFYVLNSRGKPTNVRHFVALDASGKGRELTWASFDEARNWTLIEALLNDERAPVRHIFVLSGLRARLLAYAARKGASKDVLAHAAAVMGTPRDADLHDDHFHVRIACPESMGDVCIDEAAPHREGANAKRGEPSGAASDKPEAAPATDTPAALAAPDAPTADEGSKSAP